MNNIAIITARGGSKRIPMKNIKPFCGKPIIAYSIEAALKSEIFDEVMVSTDSIEIAEISKKYGATVPFFRSPETSNDFATTNDVLSEVLEGYLKKGRTFDTLCCIYPTAPFISATKLSKSLDMMQKSGADSLMPVVAFSFPPQRGMRIDNGRLQYLFPEQIQKRSQDLDLVYHDCGQFYFCRVEAFNKNHSLISANMIPFVLPEEEVQDIDNLSDWKLAELKYQAWISGKE